MMNAAYCIEMVVQLLQLNHAIAGKKEPFEHVNIDWGFVLVRELYSNSNTTM